jgi:hypothetical protein
MPAAAGFNSDKGQLSPEQEVALMHHQNKTDIPFALRVKPFCQRVGISPSTFWKYVGLGKIRVIRIGGRVLIPHAEVIRITSEGVN